MGRALLLSIAVWATLPACGDDDGDGGGDGDADADADADADGDGDDCGLDCSGLDSLLPWDGQQALPTCEDNDTWTEEPVPTNVQRDDQDRVVHWEVAIHYQNNHLFVMRYDVASFCADGTMEDLSVEAESFDPLGTWTCQQFFFCM